MILTIERDRLEEILLAALPAEPKWKLWVTGVLDTVEDEAQK